MVVGRWLNSFSVAQSDPGCLRRADSSIPAIYMDGKEYFAGVAMTSSVFNGAHIWRERGLSGADFFISDILKDEITRAELRLPPSYKMKSV
jgi:hypothetical protein